MSKFTRESLKNYWLDDLERSDREISVFVFVIVLQLVYLANLHPPAPQMVQIYSVLASAAGTGLGFVIAALTLVVSLIPSVAQAFSPKTLSDLRFAFEVAFKWAIFCILISLLGMLWPSRLIIPFVAATGVYFFSSVLRTVYLLFELNKGVINEFIDRQEDAEVKASDRGTISLLPSTRVAETSGEYKTVHQPSEDSDGYS